MLISGCYNSATADFSTDNLSDLQSLSQQNMAQTATAPSSDIRVDAIKETALALGAQGGLAWRSREIDEVLKASRDNLSIIFNFNPLILENNVLPPVLIESKQSLELSSNDTIRISDSIYKIVKPARFITAAPTWVDYLWMNFSSPDMPDTSLLPKNMWERKYWILYITKGWMNGIRQANNIYANNLAKLKRDFNGIMLYRELLSKHMVTKPFVVKTNLGITSNKDRTKLSIDDRILRITAASKLNPNAKQWKPILVFKKWK